jgi:hypothetical protein
MLTLLFAVDTICHFKTKKHEFQVTFHFVLPDNHGGKEVVGGQGGEAGRKWYVFYDYYDFQ